LRKLHNEELRNLYTSPYIIRKMRWMVHVARIVKMRNLYNIFVGKRKGKDHLGDPSVDGRIILK